MNPAKALEMQGLMRDRMTSPVYQQFMQNFMESVDKNKWGPVFTNEQGKPDGYEFCRREKTRLEMSEAYFVKKEMMPLISWAAAGLDIIDRFEHDLWPTDFGFLYFEDGWVGVELWGRATVTNAISWGRVVLGKQRISGTLMVMYSDLDDERDMVSQEILAGPTADLARRHGPLMVQHMTFFADGERVGPPTLNFAEVIGEEQADNLWHSDGERLALSTEEAPSMTRFFLALLMMLNQTVTDVAPHEVDRQSARRFRRMGLPKQVTVVQLRRHKNIDRLEGETLVEWAHRWLVRGHWRNQPYKAEDGTTAYRRIWIAPYVKGPEDKPFKQTDKVYALVR